MSGAPWSTRLTARTIGLGDNRKNCLITPGAPKEALSVSTLEQIATCLVSALDIVGCRLRESHSDNPEVSQISMATDSARLIRNACAGCLKNQQVLTSQEEFYPSVLGFIRDSVLYLKENNKTHIQQEVLTLLKCCIQMLGNSAAGCTENGKIIWKLYFNSFQSLLSLSDPGLSSCTCMLVYNCLLTDTAGNISQLVTTLTGCDLLRQILGCVLWQENEWGVFIIEKALTRCELFPAVYQQADHDSKHLLLEITLSVIQRRADDSPREGSVAMETLQYVCTEFRQNAHSILGLSQAHSVSQQESCLVTKQLELICGVTSLPTLYAPLLDNDDLVKCAINLLHCIHMIGQEGGNDFSTVSKVSELDHVDPSHPIYGLKRDLIRLIANMAYKHTHNQNLIRELGGIPLVMDHTNIDGRNPFITQWSVFAMRNLLAGNHDNQTVVAGMRLDGLAGNVDQLREFGVEAEVVEGRVVVKNADKQETSPFSWGQ